MNAVSIANAWVELLVDNQAFHDFYDGNFNWFVIGLKIDVDQLSHKARTFLKLN